jgi:CelD/BcsL family acetyltransferase involved in cellulose biosynthesis
VHNRAIDPSPDLPPGGRRSETAASELLVESVDDLEGLRPEWSALGERSGNLFATWEWNSTWWQHFGSGHRLLVTACRARAGSLVALLPAYVARAGGGVKLVRLLGHGQGDRLGPICLPPDAERAAAALRAALRSKPWRNAVLLAEQLPADERWAGRLKGRTIGREASPVLEVTTRDWDEFLAGRSANLRQQIRRKERQLAREHDLRYRLVEDADALSDALDVLFALHGTRWGEAGAAEYGRAEPFHRAFAAHAHERGWLRLWLLEVDGQPVAAWHGFRFGGADWYYQSGRDPAWDRYSVGGVLLAHTIRDCVEAGVGRYLFLRGDEPYKFRFATSDPGLETVALGSGVAGRAGVAALQAARRLPPAPRRRLARLLAR